MSSQRNMATTSQARPYQGYPYTNPSVTDAPSIDRSVQNQWSHLPRKPIKTPKITMPSPGPSNPQPEIEDEARTPDFTRDTILYNPFDNNRIELNSSQNSPKHITVQMEDSGSDDEEEIPRIYVNPGPQELDYGGPSTVTPSLPGFFDKRPNIYRGNDDHFELSPIPVSEFPEPPPSYSEIDRVVVTPVPQPTDLPRTRVIISSSGRDPPPPRSMNKDRQHLKCPHCDKQVNTVVIRESGVATHVLAWALCFLFVIYKVRADANFAFMKDDYVLSKEFIYFKELVPFTILIYCSDCCKYKNHYCPECNKLIGYEIPMTCQDFVYA